MEKGATDIEEIQSLSINNCFPSQGIGLDWYILATASMCLSEKTPCLARDLRSKTTQLVTNLRLLEGITVFDLQGPPKAIEQELIFTSLDLEEVLRWMTMMGYPMDGISDDIRCFYDFIVGNRIGLSEA